MTATVESPEFATVGAYVQGTWCSVPFTGTVTEACESYGRGGAHTINVKVALDEPMESDGIYLVETAVIVKVKWDGTDPGLGQDSSIQVAHECARCGEIVGDNCVGPDDIERYWQTEDCWRYWCSPECAEAASEEAGLAQFVGL